MAHPDEPAARRIYDLGEELISLTGYGSDWTDPIPTALNLIGSATAILACAELAVVARTDRPSGSRAGRVDNALQLLHRAIAKLSLATDENDGKGGRNHRAFAPGSTRTLCGIERHAVITKPEWADCPDCGTAAF